MTTPTVINGTRSTIANVAATDAIDVLKGGYLEITGSVASGATIDVESYDPAGTVPTSTLKIDNALNFGGTLILDNGLVDLGGLSQYGHSDILDWHLDGNVLSMDTRGGQYVHFNFFDASPSAGHGTNIQIAQLGDDFYITEGGLHQPAGATLLNGMVNPPPAAAAAISVHDTTTNADVADTYTQAYTGPVSGLIYQATDITPDSLNITSKVDNIFIKTGAGNRADA